MSSLDTCRMETHAGTVFDALRVRHVPSEDTPYCPFGNIKGLTNDCSFHTHHRNPYHTPSLSFGRPYHGCQAGITPVKCNRESEFMGHCFVTTGSITTKHGRNLIGKSISGCRNFHKNIRSSTEKNKSLKANLIIKNKVVSHLERGTYWINHKALIFVVLFNDIPLHIYSVSRIEKDPLVRKFSKTKTKTAIFLRRIMFPSNRIK